MSLNTGNIGGNPNFNTTGAIKIPVGTSAQRPGNPRVGDLRFNTDLGVLEIYAGATPQWHPIGSVASPFSATFVSLFTTSSRTAAGSIGSAYNNSQLNGQVTLNGGKQIWSVPSSGWWRFDAYGAQGGTNSTGVGGGGARIRGDFFLEQGETLEILCGSAGYLSTNDCDTGGGGGTYVVKQGGTSVSDILVIAAGGGGASNQSFNSQGRGDAANYSGTGSDGKHGDASQIASNGAGGRGGSGGYAGDRSLSGSARGNPGGGFYAGLASYTPNPTWSETRAGASYLDGAQGGTANDAANSFGGFGGGGGGHGNCFISGGGGGGWNGGGCEVQYTSYHGGQGGGSINNGGLNPVGTSGANRNNTVGGQPNHGRVEVTKIGL